MVELIWGFEMRACECLNPRGLLLRSLPKVKTRIDGWRLTRHINKQFETLDLCLAGKGKWTLTNLSKHEIILHLTYHTSLKKHEYVSDWWLCLHTLWLLIFLTTVIVQVMSLSQESVIGETSDSDLQRRYKHQVAALPVFSSFVNYTKRSASQKYACPPIPTFNLHNLKS